MYGIEDALTALVDIKTDLNAFSERVRDDLGHQQKVLYAESNVDSAIISIVCAIDELKEAARTLQEGA